MESKIISVEQMRKSDAYTIEHFVPSKELMYRAAAGVYESYEEWTDKKLYNRYELTSEEIDFIENNVKEL